MSSLGLSTSAFLDLARRAPRNWVAWFQLSEILLRVSRSTASWAESTPSDDPDSPVNTAMAVFRAIGITVSARFSSHPSPADRAALILRLRPYIVTCTIHFINDIIVPGREAEFQGDISEVPANLVSTLASAQLDTTENYEILSFRAPEELRTTGKTFFLTCVLTRLLFPALPSTPCQKVLALCFVAIGYIIGLESDHSLPLYARELYDALLAESERFAALFLSCTVDAIGSFQAESFTPQDPAYSNVVSCYRPVSFRRVLHHAPSPRWIHTLDMRDDGHDVAHQIIS